MTNGALEGLLFLSGFLAFGLVVAWVVTVDARGMKGASKGLFAMKGAASDEAASSPARQPRWKRNGSVKGGEQG